MARELAGENKNSSPWQWGEHHTVLSLPHSNLCSSVSICGHLLNSSGSRGMAHRAGVCGFHHGFRGCPDEFVTAHRSLLPLLRSSQIPALSSPHSALSFPSAALRRDRAGSSPPAPVSSSRAGKSAWSRRWHARATPAPCGCRCRSRAGAWQSCDETHAALLVC